MGLHINQNHIFSLSFACDREAKIQNSRRIRESGGIQTSNMSPVHTLLSLPDIRRHNFCVFRTGNDNQNGGNGNLREEHLPGRLLEPPGFLHCPGRTFRICDARGKFEFNSDTHNKGVTATAGYK